MFESATPEWVYWVLVIMLLGAAALGTKRRMDKRRKMGLPPAMPQDQARDEDLK